MNMANPWSQQQDEWAAHASQRVNWERQIPMTTAVQAKSSLKKSKLSAYLNASPASAFQDEFQPLTQSVFFLQNIDFQHGILLQTKTPSSVTSTLHPLRRPRLMEVTKAILNLMQPCVLFVQFPCKRKCRSMGICIHFQFVIGTQRCPDGLICGRCMDEAPKKVRTSV
jgi:hypothetical protein